ncbi:MAG: LPS-assembly protein LptD [Candidatus Omnitrophica bacterium]|nr:LPS-assembly protein LptD [Candidatus Omnitrophota bacterium]
MRFKTIICLGIFVFFVSLTAWAADEKIPIICHGDKVEFLEAEQKMRASGNVEVLYEDIKITCDKANINLKTKDGIAEGDITLYQKDSILTGERVEYNFDSQTGIMYRAGFASQRIYGKGPQVIKESPTDMSMNDSYMTTCDLAHPHYRIESKTVKIYLEDKIVMKHVIIYVFDIPTIYLPYYSYSLKEPKRPKVSVYPGKDSDWGYYLLTNWRYEFSRYLKGILHLDYRERRDFASGFDNYYDLRKYGQGFVKTYYMNERKLEGGNRLWDEDAFTHERERYMIHNRHSWDIDQYTDLRMEYWNLSDTQFLKDYMLKTEYEREPQPESYISVIRSKSDYTLSFLGKRRFNKIFTRTEYQPEVELSVPGLRIKDSQYYWKTDTSFANISRKLAHPSNIDDDTVRFDTYNEFKRISKVGFLHITPYVGSRETYYSKDRYGDRDWWRTAFHTGVDVETKFFKIFNVSTDKWGMDINNLRHVITPRVRYSYIHTPTILPEKLFHFDSVDSLNRLNRYNFSLENKLQTKRKVAGEGYESVDLARLLISTFYDYRRPGGSRFGNVNFDFEFTPFNWLTLEFDTAYDHRADRFQTFNLDLYMDQHDKWRTGLGYRYAHENHAELAFELSFKPNPLWKLGTYQRFMFKGYPNRRKKINSLLVQEYRLVRDLHCWTSEILYTISRGQGESIYFIFRLKGFEQMPLEFGTSYHRPKPGSQNPIR